MHEPQLGHMERRLSGCGAVIVTFNPDGATIAEVLAAVRPQVDWVCVIDNGSHPHVADVLQSLCAPSNVEFVSLGVNRGIAAAHNEGLARAQARSLAYVLILDHDSVPAPDLVQQLQRAHRTLAADGQQVAGVGARWFDERSGRQGQFYRVRQGRVRPVPLHRGSDPVAVDFLISSGTLLWMPAVKDVGSLRDDLFIDHVDTEWCLRARLRGWHLFGVPGAHLRHALGDATARVWLGRWREVALHSPDRNYYEVRNTVILLRMPGISMNWRIAHALRLLQVIVFYGAFVPPRLLRVRRIGRALRDGWLGRGGPLR